MRRPPLALFAAVALVGGLVPLVLAPPVGGFGDGSELMLVLARDGVAHPTGYPLWTILGHGAVVVFHALGMGWARAAAGWSALGAATALWFLQLLAWRWADPDDAAPARPWIAAACALAALVLLFDPIWLEQATTAEVYTWHVAWACAAAWCALDALKRPGDVRAAAGLGFVLGLGLAHHRSSVFLAAALGVAWFVLAVHAAGWRAALARLGIGMAAALVPLSSFAWIAWRAFHPGPAQWPALDASWNSAWYHVSGGQYHDLLGRFAPDADAQALLARDAYPVLVPGLVLLAAAVARAWRAGAAARAGAIALAAGAALTTAWAFTYAAPDPEAYFLLPMALGLAALAPAVARLAAARSTAAAWRRVAPVAVVGLGLGLAAWAVVGVRASLAARADTLSKDAVVRLMWQSLPADSSLVFWPGDPYVRLQAYQQLDGEKPSLYVMTPALLGFAAQRKAFESRFGFDPMAGFHFELVHSGASDEAQALQRLYRALLLHVSARTPKAVYVMVPEQGILRLVPKDRDPSATAPSAP